MEGAEAENNADNEYMTMDADEWLEQDDTYENGDTLGLDLSAKQDSRGREPDSASRGNNIEEIKRERVATNRAPQSTENQRTAQASNQSDLLRYITVRRPPINANKGKGNKLTPDLAFFKHATVCLVVLCILLFGVLLGMSFAYVSLAVIHQDGAEKTAKLLEENERLNKELEGYRNVSMAAYHVSSNEYPDCLTGRALFVLNYEVLEELTECSFYLFKSNMNGGGCNSSFSWSCTRRLQ